MNLREQLDKVQMDLLAERANGQSKDQDKINDLERQEASLLQQIMEANNQQAHQERVQTQTEKIQAITLPFDYNEILGNTLANETIIENVKQFQQQAYEEHNAEVARINAEHSVEINNLKLEFVAKLEITEELWKDAVRETSQLQQRLNAETEQAKKDAIELNTLTQQVAQLGLELNQSRNDNDDLRTQVAQLTLERNDLFSKREAAANALVEANRQIEILKTPQSPSPSIISVNDHLADLATRAKQNTINQINKNLARFEIPAINIPTLPESPIEPLNLVTEVEAPAEAIPFHIQTTDDAGVQPDVRNELENAVVAQSNQESEVITLESLKSELDALKSAHGTTVTRVDTLFQNQEIAQTFKDAAA